jgi:hypothetical protein
MTIVEFFSNLLNILLAQDTHFYALCQQTKTSTLSGRFERPDSAKKFSPLLINAIRAGCAKPCLITQHF